VTQWRNRFAAKRLEGLQDEPVQVKPRNMMLKQSSVYSSSSTKIQPPGYIQNGKEIHVKLDNLRTHRPKNDRWLARQKNVHFQVRVIGGEKWRIFIRDL
jgi:hypothetical protein